MVAAAEAIDVDQLPMIEIRTPTLYSFLPKEQVPLDVPQLLLQCNNACQSPMIIVYADE